MGGGGDGHLATRNGISNGYLNLKTARAQAHASAMPWAEGGNNRPCRAEHGHRDGSRNRPAAPAQARARRQAFERNSQKAPERHGRANPTPGTNPPQKTQPAPDKPPCWGFGRQAKPAPWCRFAPEGPRARQLGRVSPGHQPAHENAASARKRAFLGLCGMGRDGADAVRRDWLGRAEPQATGPRATFGGRFRVGRNPPRGWRVLALSVGLGFGMGSGWCVETVAPRATLRGGLLGQPSGLPDKPHRAALGSPLKPDHEDGQRCQAGQQSQ